MALLGENIETQFDNRRCDDCANYRGGYCEGVGIEASGDIQANGKHCSCYLNAEANQRNWSRDCESFLYWDL